MAALGAYPINEATRRRIVDIGVVKSALWTIDLDKVSIPHSLPPLPRQAPVAMKELGIQGAPCKPKPYTYYDNHSECSKQHPCPPSHVFSFSITLTNAVASWAGVAVIKGHITASANEMLAEEANNWQNIAA